MEKSTNRILNELLVNLFNNVMEKESKAVITEEFKVLPIMICIFWRQSA